MAVEAVVFDIGNVLIEWRPERVFDRAIGSDRRKALFAEVDLDGMNARVDLGEDMGEAVAALARAHPNWADEIQIWHDRWLDMASPAIDHSVKLQRALRARGVPVYALTNFGVSTFELAETHYPFFAEFDQRFVSGFLGVMKPDPAIYEILERDTGQAPEGLLFADDRADNIAMAASRGWQTHLFDAPGAFADRLVREGLLSPAEAAP
jgi:2-haloacid dehalogenase